MGRSFTPPYDVGVVGAGNVTTTFHLPILSDLPEVEVSYIADVNRERARIFTGIYGGDPVPINNASVEIPSADILLLATPVGVRETYVDAAAEMDAKLFAEKPFATDFEEHCNYLDKLSEPTTCNYMRTSYSSVQQLAAIVSGGIFGRIESVTMTRGLIGSTGISPGSFRTDPSMSGGGVLMEKGCHDLSQLIEIFGNAHMEVIESNVTWKESLDVAVEAILHVEKPHDIDVDFRISMVEPYETIAIFEFENATVRFEHPEASDTLEISIDVGRRGTNESMIIEHADKASQTTEEAMYHRWRSFLDCDQHEDYDNKKGTYLSVSRLVTELYDMADSPTEVNA
jgi:predicted dehydrogenase